METDGVRDKILGDEIEKVDRLSNLPECLVLQILLNLPIKDVVKCSVLSSRWRNLWKILPGLDLKYGDFPDFDKFVSFVDGFLGFGSDSCLQKFKLDYGDSFLVPDTVHFPSWINTLVRRRVQHLHVSVGMLEELVEIPLTVYTFESLVSLELCNVILPHPKFVSLPCVKVIELDLVRFANPLALGKLISGCPVLERLSLRRSLPDKRVLCVISQSLLSFILVDTCKDLMVDAPRLEYLKLSYSGKSVTINNPDSLVKVDLGITFNLSFEERLDPNDLPRNMIRNFLVGISSVKHMVISLRTLEVIYNYSRCERLPLFHNLFSLVVNVYGDRWEMLPIFLESCPNLKSLDLVFSRLRLGVSILPGHRRFLTSLEYVKIKNLRTDEATEMKLVSYFLEKSTILKRFTLCLCHSRKKEESVILEKLLVIPRLSSSCEIVVVNDEHRRFPSRRLPLSSLLM